MHQCVPIHTYIYAFFKGAGERGVLMILIGSKFNQELKEREIEELIIHRSLCVLNIGEELRGSSLDYVAQEYARIREGEIILLKEEQVRSFVDQADDGVSQLRIESEFLLVRTDVSDYGHWREEWEEVRNEGYWSLFDRYVTKWWRVCQRPDNISDHQETRTRCTVPSHINKNQMLLKG